MKRSIGLLVDEIVISDIVVVGAGAAGLRAALAAGPRSVQVLTAGDLGGTGSSPLAQGGVAAALGAGDSPAEHAADTIAAAAGSADERAVRHLVEQGPAEIHWLRQLGAQFDSDRDGRPTLGREAAHSHPRIVHAGGDATGAELMRVLAEQISSCRNVRVVEHARVDSIVRSGHRAVGVLAVHPGGRLVFHQGEAVVLATGGLGGLYLKTTNPATSCGLGLAMAALAGARLVDLEFVQFHPTALDVSGDSLPLLTEALRGAGAHLVDAEGVSIMAGVHPAGDLAPRDVVARSVWWRRKQGAEVFLDARSVIAETGPDRFPTLMEVSRQHGLDPERQRLPVTPAAHFSMGGVWTDLEGRTTLPGLWACGEVACTGVHGANRLASNSLLEALVFGRWVGESVREASSGPRLRPGTIEVSDWQRRSVVERPEHPVADLELRALMWSKVGLVRDRIGLQEALQRIDGWAEGRSNQGSLSMPLMVARMLALAGLFRQESRGSHYRSDYPGKIEGGESPIFIAVDGWTDGLPHVAAEGGLEPVPLAVGEGVSP